MGGTGDGIVKEILQSTEQFQLFDVNRTDGGGGERRATGGVGRTQEVVVGQ